MRILRIVRIANKSKFLKVPDMDWQEEVRKARAAMEKGGADFLDRKPFIPPTDLPNEQIEYWKEGYLFQYQLSKTGRYSRY